MPSFPVFQTTAATTAQTSFSLALVQHIAQATGGANVTVSPLGILAALALAMSGTDGNAKKALSEVLFGTNGSTAQAEAAFAAWLRQLLHLDDKPTAEEQFGSVLKLATSLWAGKPFIIAPAFANQARTYYNAEAATLDFAVPAAATTINNWVHRHTQGRISAIVSADMLNGNPLSEIILLNAVYFRAQWADAFDPNDTRDGFFSQADGTVQVASLMHQVNSSFGYMAGTGWQAVSIPYIGYPRSCSMHIFLPDEPAGLTDFLATLSPANWAAWHKELTSSEELEVELFLPRFSVEWSADVAPALRQLGLAPVFAPDADFSALGFRQEAGGGFIDTVLHKTFLNVDEIGTEAAAVTAIMWMGGGAHEPRTLRQVTVKVDSPFFYAVVDNQDGALLFTGTINKLN